MGAIPFNTDDLPIATNINYGPESSGHRIHTLTPQIFWSYYDLPPSTQAQFHIQVGINDDWTTAEMWDSGPIMSTDTSVVYQGQSLIEGTKYYLRIRVNNGNKWGNWTGNWFIFKISNLIEVPGDFPSIQAGIDEAVDGDTVIVSQGTYIEYINFEGKNIVVTSISGPDMTIIQAPYEGNKSLDTLIQSGDTLAISISKAPSKTATAVVSMISDEPKRTEISGFTITGGGNSGIYCVGASPTIQNNIITLNSSTYGAAINLYYTTNAMIRDNIIYDNTAELYGAAIHQENCSDDTICYNIVYNNNGVGAFRIKDSYTYIYNNTISSTLRDCIISHNSAFLVVSNNILFNSPKYGVYAAAGGAADVAYNCSWNNAAGSYYGIQIGDGNIYDNPLFINESLYDYNLNYDSPCIDAGHPDPIYNDPDGTRNDIGALYFMMGLPYASYINMDSEDESNVVNHTPTFRWTFYDPEGVQVAYQVEVGTDNDWSIAESWYSGEVYSSNEYTQYDGAYLEDGLDYYVRILLFNGTNWGDWVVYQFHMNSIPEAPVPTKPINGEIVHILDTKLSVENSSDLENDDKTYSFEVYSDIGLSLMVYSEEGVEEQEDLTTSGLVSGLEADETYWWRARANDGYENSDWSIVQTFNAIGSKVIKVPEEYSTIQAAVDASSYADTILVEPGTYIENINFHGNSVCLKGSGGPSTTIIQPANPTVQVIRISAGQEDITTVEGFSITGGESEYVVEIINSSPTIKNNIFFDNHPNREVVSLNSSGALITRNLFYNNGGISCVGLRLGSIDGRIINNTFNRNNRGFFGICGGGTAINNIVTNSGEYGIYGLFSMQDFNLVYNNTLDYDGGAGPGANNISENPFYLDEVNNIYSLRDNSPCINAGNPDPQYNDPDGSRNDMGAYYFDLGSLCDCVPGECNGVSPIDILDIVHLIDYKFKGCPPGSPIGTCPPPTPYPVCSGDTDCNCIMDILDIVLMIDWKFKECPPESGNPCPPPCSCEDWLIQCGWPIY
jgi:hypothetical protein